LGRCVEWRTLLFNVVVEPVLLQDPIQPCVKRMCGASRQILCGNPHRWLTIFSFPLPMAMRVLYVNMDKLVEKKLLERLLPRAASQSRLFSISRLARIFFQPTQPSL